MIKNFKVYVVKSGLVSATEQEDGSVVKEWAGGVSFSRRKQAEPLIEALTKFGHDYEVVEEKRSVVIPDA